MDSPALWLTIGLILVVGALEYLIRRVMRRKTKEKRLLAAQLQDAARERAAERVRKAQQEQEEQEAKAAKAAQKARVEAQAEAARRQAEQDAHDAREHEREEAALEQASEQARLAQIERIETIRTAHIRAQRERELKEAEAAVQFEMDKLAKQAQAAPPRVTDEPFTLTFPDVSGVEQSVAQQAAIEPQAPAIPPLTNQPPLVLVVDDSKLVRVKTGRLLSQHQYRVSYAVDGQDATEQIRRGAVPDVVITDAEMSPLDGFGLARHIRANPLTAHVPIIMITGATDRHRDSAREAGVTEMFGKPYDDDALLGFIQSATNSTVDFAKADV